MPRPDDPFDATPDGNGQRDPFSSLETPGYASTSGSEVADPFADADEETDGHDPFGPQPLHHSDARRPLGKPFARQGFRVVAVALLAALGVVALLALRQDRSGRTLGEESHVDRSTAADLPGPDLPIPAVSSRSSTVPPTTSPLTTASEPAVRQESTPATTVVPESGTARGVETEPEALSGCEHQPGRDPHGLIRMDEIIERLAFCGEETWQVFVCTTRESDQADRVAYVDSVLGEAAAWFDWASAGQYDIDFSAGDDTTQVWSTTDEAQQCFDEALRTRWSETRSGAVVLVDGAALDPHQNYAGVGTCGYLESATVGEFGESHRMVAIAVHAGEPQTAIAVHELGHAQCWPHSYSGRTATEYDNPGDVMSFLDNWPLGTIAVNRYASGWIHPDEVRVHRESAGAYTLSPCCSGGVQMLALLPADVSEEAADFNRQWWHLEVRDPDDEWERGLGDVGVGEELGVLVHWIDQHLGLGAQRRQAPVGGQVDFWGEVPVHVSKLSTGGSEFCLHSDQPTSLIDCSGAHEWRIEVIASQTGGLNLAVAPGA